MEEIQRWSAPIRFGVFEVDLRAGELRRQGFKVKLQEQPFQVLAMLLERPGGVVTREELQKKLWSSDTFVDFERGLNRAINKLREALADEAESPRFIETLPRRGYRFVAPVEADRTPEPDVNGRGPITLVPADRPHALDDSAAPVAVPRRPGLPWAAAGILALIAGIAGWKLWFTPTIALDRPFQQLDLDAGPDGFSQPAISQDGMRVVFVSKRGLAIRLLAQSQTTVLAGTEGAAAPFFSPNGQWVAFFAAGKLQKVAVEGGAPIPLCEAPSPGGGTWEADDHIVAALDVSRGLFGVSAAGGTLQQLTNPGADPSRTVMHRWPQALPRGKGILFAATNASLEGSLQVLASNGSHPRTVVQNSTYGRFLASGHLIYLQRGVLFAAPMDVDRLELTGSAVPLISAVSIADGRADFDLSSTGTLVYRRGKARSSLPSWIDASGKIETTPFEAGNYSTPRLSPDGKQLALAATRDGKQSLWVYDLSRGTRHRLTSEDESELLPTWTPDGEFIAFGSGNGLAWTQSDGSGKVERLVGVSRNTAPYSFSPDGKWLAFWPLEPGSDLWAAPVMRAPGVLRLGEPEPLLRHAGSNGAPNISPDGRWLAYASQESGRFEIYVMPFPLPGTATSRKWTVSNGGGHTPRWSPNGRELFYESPDHRIQVAAYSVTPDSFAAEKPRLWSETRMADIDFFPAFDVAADGRRVLALLPAENDKPETILHVLLNVDSELRPRSPRQNALPFGRGSVTH